MQKAERLLKILTLLQSRRRAVTAQALAEHLQVSERTIYRDVQALILSGIPIEGEAGVGYILQKGSLLSPIMFDETELEALILGVRMVQGWSDKGLSQSADGALEKIRAVLPDRLHHLLSHAEETLLVPNYEQQPFSQFNQQLRNAIKKKYKVIIEYHDEKHNYSERTIWPLGLVYWGKIWTLISWCELRDDYRSFRVDRIQQLTPVNSHFTTSEQISLQNYLSNDVGEC